MATNKVAITLDEELLVKVDNLVKSGLYANRSKAIQQALREKIMRLERVLLAKECAKLDKNEEQKLADEGLAEDLAEWPEY